MNNNLTKNTFGRWAYIKSTHLNEYIFLFFYAEILSLNDIF